MFKFIKESISEFEHVVWPTPNETKKYMNYTVGVIVVVGAFLAVLGYGIRGGLEFTRDQFPHDAVTPVVSGEDYATRDDLKAITDALEAKRALSGATASGAVATGTTR